MEQKPFNMKNILVKELASSSIACVSTIFSKQRSSPVCMQSGNFPPTFLPAGKSSSNRKFLPRRNVVPPQRVPPIGIHLERTCKFSTIRSLPLAANFTSNASARTAWHSIQRRIVIFPYTNRVFVSFCPVAEADYTLDDSFWNEETVFGKWMTEKQEQSGNSGSREILTSCALFAGDKECTGTRSCGTIA